MLTRMSKSGFEPWSDVAGFVGGDGQADGGFLNEVEANRSLRMGK